MRNTKIRQLKQRIHREERRIAAGAAYRRSRTETCSLSPNMGEFGGGSRSVGRRLRPPDRLERLEMLAMPTAGIAELKACLEELGRAHRPRPPLAEMTSP